MKKILTACATAISLSAFAADIDVSTIRDLNTDRAGVKVTVASGNVASMTPSVSISNIENAYTRYAAEVSKQLISVGNLKLSATGGGVYQDTKGGSNGYGLVAGVKATLPITPSVLVSVGAERFIGQERVNSFNGNTASVGIKFTF